MSNEAIENLRRQEDRLEGALAAVKRSMWADVVHVVCMLVFIGLILFAPGAWSPVSACVALGWMVGSLLTHYANGSLLRAKDLELEIKDLEISRLQDEKKR